MLDEDGTLAIAMVTPSFQVLSQVALLKRIAWTPPTLVGTSCIFATAALHGAGSGRAQDRESLAARLTGMRAWLTRRAKSRHKHAARRRIFRRGALCDVARGRAKTRDASRRDSPVSAKIWRDLRVRSDGNLSLADGSPPLSTHNAPHHPRSAFTRFHSCASMTTSSLPHCRLDDNLAVRFLPPLRTHSPRLRSARIMFMKDSNRCACVADAQFFNRRAAADRFGKEWARCSSTSSVTPR